tara:strand:- start:136 stop:756 length:621 start_codon:yes stop_codon:yes gene_type:complete
MGITLDSIDIDWIWNNSCSVSTMPTSYNSDTSDEDLIKAYKRGDQNAFHLIIKRYEKALLGYIKSMVFSQTVAEEICQECFIKLCQKPPHYLWRSKVKSWLFKVARNLITDAIRKNRESNTPISEISELASESTPVKEIHKKEQYSQLALMIQRLKEEYREVISLHYYAEMSYKEILKLLKKPIGTVLWQAQQALQIMRKEKEDLK